MNIKPTLMRYSAAAAAAGALTLGIPAAATDLADVPMAVKNTVQPNIMFTLDDSGSMQWDVMPDHYTINDYTGAFFVFPRPDTLYGKTYSNSYGTITNAAWYYNGVVRFDSGNRYARYFRTARFNPLYYNPEIRYFPWAKSDGSFWDNVSPTAAPYNPDNSGEGTLNLTQDKSDSYPWLNNDGTETTKAVTYYPATYYKYICTTALTGPADSNNLEACFTKVEIKPGNAPFPKAAGRTDCAGATCTYAEEIQNFANWFSYYRSRILAARAGIGRAFSVLNTSVRVGFGAINNGSASIDGVSTSTIKRGVRKFDGTDRTAFFTELYSHKMPGAGTPLRRAMDDVGQYFSRADDKGPYGENPGVGGGTQFACRANYHILMTDGYWNNGSGEAGTSGARNNNDGTGGPTISTPSSYTYQAVQPYWDSYSNTLADVAMYYWKNDLRADLANRVPTNAKDPAYWQHMVNFTVGFGVTGNISSSTISSALSEPGRFNGNPDAPNPPEAGADSLTVTWPDPVAADANKVDDLAHAAVNSRGGFFSAADPVTFATALSSALQDIASRSGAAAAVAVANANLVSGDSMSYASGYNSGDWSGELAAYLLDPATGIPSSDPIWTAKSQLDSRTSADRYIASYTGMAGSNQGIRFQPASAGTSTKLSTAQQNLLNTPPSGTDGADVVAYLRGDRSKEGSTYRTRAHLLGDIINAEPVIVRGPRANYTDAGYADFKAAKANRTKVVYQGANDGMLHAFKAENPNGGRELWAYVPNLLMSSLNNLTLKSGYVHRYYVDGTPAAGDVDFKNTDGATGNGTDWRTILVGGLNKGGRGYYALDITDPDVTDEDAVAAKVLWEFPNSGTSDTDRKNMGYSFAKPIIVKTETKGWVVLFTSGYNNGSDTGGDGQGYLFIVNPRTGEVITRISTGVGTASDPSGLAQISAYVENGDIDNTVDFVYGGDLKGNLWRFDLRGNVNSWNVKKIATLVDAAGNFQPITSSPELAKINFSGSYKRLVYVGTGRYLGDTDVPGTMGANSHATQTQTMYALVDDQSNSPTITPLRSNLVQQQVTSEGLYTTTSVDFAVKKGWYLDLPSSGERIVTDPAIAVTTLVFTSNIPNSDPCTPGGSSKLYALDFAFETGRTPVTPSVVSYSNALASRAVLVKTASGEIRALVRKSDATTETTSVPGQSGSTTTKRVSWRELPE
ncbi:MAG: pilus assembly protein [Pseudomonadota bacterium]